MSGLLYIIAVILIVGWLIGFFAFHAGGLIHLLRFGEYQYYKHNAKKAETKPYGKWKSDRPLHIAID